MVNIKDIPAEVRWEIATRAANDNRVIGKMTGCPMLNAHRNVGYGPTAGTPSHCEYVIELKKQLANNIHIN